MLKELGLLENGEVTLEGWQTFSELLDHFKPYPVFVGINPSPFSIFEKYMSKVVPTCIEMALIQDGDIYLTYREDKYWKGYHFPRTYIGPRETLAQTCQRIADREAPGIRIITAEIIGCVTGVDNPRFHDASLITRAIFEGKITDNVKGKWFPEMPDDIIVGHDLFWPMIEPYLKKK